MRLIFFVEKCVLFTKFLRTFKEILMYSFKPKNTGTCPNAPIIVEKLVVAILGLFMNPTFLEKLMRTVLFLKTMFIQITSENLGPIGQVLDTARERQKSPYKLNIRSNTVHFLW
jgi:hypothetical protein